MGPSSGEGIPNCSIRWAARESAVFSIESGCQCGAKRSSSIKASTCDLIRGVEGVKSWKPAA